jgi:hypothetical protein
MCGEVLPQYKGKFYRNTREGVRGQVIVFGNNDEFYTVQALSWEMSDYGFSFFNLCRVRPPAR